MFLIYNWIDDYRRLQRNLTRSYADQLALLGEQRRALLETRRLETASLKEIQNLHASIKREMKVRKLTFPTHE